MDLYKHSVICSDKVFQISNASYYLFGILTSEMHMAWMKVIGGRLKGDYSYSNTLVYNNFVFPESTAKQKDDIEKCAKQILYLRNEYEDSTLADLYDSLAMPPGLLKAHQDLDKVVDKAYGRTFKTDDDRLTFLFDLYAKEALPK